MLPAMVLAAGLGTRLRPLTDLRPKPLVPVGDRPALAHVLDRLAPGFGPVVVNAHHGLPQMRAFLDRRPGVVLSEETELLGTAGGVARALALLGGADVLVWNADILVELDPRGLVAAHANEGQPPEATLVVQPRIAGQGSVGLDDAGRIVRLRQTRAPGGIEARGGEFLGVHVIGRALRGALPARGCLVGDVYIPAMLGGATLRAHLWEGPFFDVGTLRRYLDANVAWAAARGLGSLGSWAAPSARVAPGVELRHALVGEGAVVRGAGALERCVVWPGAEVEAPLADAVAAPGHLVRMGVLSSESSS